MGRLDSLIAREKAMLIWNTRQKFAVSGPVAATIAHLHEYVASTESPWEVPLGLAIPRDPHFWSRGDASLRGGGAYCPGLRFWFDISWSPRTLHGIRNVSPSHPEFVHINGLEFIVVVLQFAAIKTRLEALTGDEALLYFPSGMPHIPVWYGETDNSVSKSWENRATSRSHQGQGLVTVYAELLRTTLLHTTCEHLAGLLNIVADDISRNDFTLSFAARCEQLFLKHPCLASYDYFQPSPELIQLLFSRLYSGPTLEACALPAVLGRFVPAGSTTCGSVCL